MNPDLLEALRKQMVGMAQKPDASAVSQTPRPTPGLLDLLHQLGQHVDARVSSGLPPGTLEGVMPDYISGPAGAEGAAAKLAAEVPAGQPGMLGALERLGAPRQGPLMQAGREPETLVGVALKHKGKVYSQQGFDGGHKAVLEDILDKEGLATLPMFSEAAANRSDAIARKVQGGFITNTGRFVDRMEGQRIAVARHQMREGHFPAIDGITTESIRP